MKEKQESFQEMIKFLIFVILCTTNRNLLVREQDPHISTFAVSFCST